MLQQVIKVLGEPLKSALGSWPQTARLAFLMNAAGSAAAIYSHFK